MTDHIEAYPLQWPVGRPRAKRRENTQFQSSLAKARDHLMNEIRLLGGKQPILSSNLELRLDGLPYANQKAPDDPGIAVYFTYKDKQHCFACDDWRLVEDNVRAIGKTIEALRGIARWGTGDMMERAFQGFEALPAPEAEPWWSVLGFFSEAEALFQCDYEIKAKKLLQKYHPDREDGDAWRFDQIVKAREAGREIRDSKNS
jgi:hypothetical protein